LWDEDYGEVYLTKYDGRFSGAFPIEVRVDCSDKRIRYSIDGYREDDRQTLRLGKDRDWDEIIRVIDLHPFDKVLIRNEGEPWHGGFFGGVWGGKVHDINLSEWSELMPATKETTKFLGTKARPELAFFINYINDETHES
jgi:hypothetical protein